MSTETKRPAVQPLASLRFRQVITVLAFLSIIIGGFLVTRDTGEYHHVKDGPGSACPYLEEAAMQTGSAEEWRKYRRLCE